MWRGRKWGHALSYFVGKKYMYCISLTTWECREQCQDKSLCELPRDKTKKMTVRTAKTQINLGICSVWSESSLCTQWVAKEPSFFHADSEDSDQTGQIPRLIRVFAGRTCRFVKRQIIFKFWWPWLFLDQVKPWLQMTHTFLKVSF